MWPSLCHFSVAERRPERQPCKQQGPASPSAGALEAAHHGLGFTWGAAPYALDLSPPRAQGGFSSSVLRKQGYCFLPFGQGWAQEPKTCPGGQKGHAVEPSPRDPRPLTHLEERGTLKAQYLITVFPDFLHFERASCQADGCESGDINITEKEGSSPGTQAQAAAGGLAQVSASVGGVASAGLAGCCCPGRPGCVLSA